MGDSGGKKQSSNRRIWIILLGTIVAYILLIAFTVMQYSGEPYQLSQSSDWIYRARATNDLVDMSKYLNKSLDIMEQYTGNPAWIFPTPDTDLDYIKENVRECIGNCEEYSTLTDEMAYQQAVHNLQETLNEIGWHISAAGNASFWQPIMIPVGFLLGFGWAIFPLSLGYIVKDKSAPEAASPPKETETPKETK
jgi:hypothetical protein